LVRVPVSSQTSSWEGDWIFMNVSMPRVAAEGGL
jgi:hypothetical protein